MERNIKTVSQSLFTMRIKWFHTKFNAPILSYSRLGMTKSLNADYKLYIFTFIFDRFTETKLLTILVVFLSTGWVRICYQVIPIAWLTRKRTWRTRHSTNWTVGSSSVYTPVTARWSCWRASFKTALERHAAKNSRYFLLSSLLFMFWLLREIGAYRRHNFPQSDTDYFYF